jgi:hypothetical protein
MYRVRKRSLNISTYTEKGIKKGKARCRKGGNKGEREEERGGRR